MIKTQWITTEHEIRMNINKEDINVIFSDPDEGTLKSWLMQMNDIAIFLKGTPDSMLCKLTRKQKATIANTLTDIAKRLIKEEV